jgi:hypothetical protein
MQKRQNLDYTKKKYALLLLFYKNVTVKKNSSFSEARIEPEEATSYLQL